MSLLVQTTKFINAVPKVALAILASVFVIGLFIVGFDQGHIFSIIYGESSFTEQFLHELTHDMRHAAGFPCH
ncbi:MAG: CbtB-domain containing protein [Candidatus Nitrosopelagicus sp.]|jgi:cobalt transporter subunit CbtB|nr:CbtB-domain containing protein [Candidatus Nitrosopelagicus sp.]